MARSCEPAKYAGLTHRTDLPEYRSLLKSHIHALHLFHLSAEPPYCHTAGVAPHPDPRLEPHRAGSPERGAPITSELAAGDCRAPAIPAQGGHWGNSAYRRERHALFSR